MEEAREAVGYMSTATGLCMEFSDFTPSWMTLQTFLFIISTGIAIFDTYTDWVVVLDFKEEGFKNPLLPHNSDWLYAWLVFASIGTFLTVVSFLHDGMSLLHDCRTCCNKRPNNSYDLGRCTAATNRMAMQMELEIDEDDDKIDDCYKCCYRCGWNSVTRTETLGALTLWFQDVPMLTLAILFAFSQTTCKTPEKRDVTPFLQDVGISIAVATAATLWRLLRSLVRLWRSIMVRINPKCCCCCCLPKKGDAAYPPDTCAQCCIVPYHLGLLMQCIAIALGAYGSYIIWANFAALKAGGNFDDSLGIYRISVYNDDYRLFNVSDMIPVNGTSRGTFTNLELIPAEEYLGAAAAAELTVDPDIYCLSEFEYRSEKFQFFFNAIRVTVISDDGRFCATYSGPDLPNYCIVFYTLENFVLYYASINPVTKEIERFDKQCSVIKYKFTTSATPKADFGIDVTRHINRTGYPENGEELVIYYPTGEHVAVSAIFAEERKIYGDVLNISNVFCSVIFFYNAFKSQINFNYNDFHLVPYWTGLEDEPIDYECVCGPSPGPNCSMVHENLKYGYITADGRFKAYTNCYEIPKQKIVPKYDPETIPVPCPCDL